MSYTPIFIFHWDDLKKDQIKIIDDNFSNDSFIEDLRQQINGFIEDPMWIRNFKGQRFAYLKFEISSRSQRCKEFLDELKIEYFEFEA